MGRRQEVAWGGGKRWHGEEARGGMGKRQEVAWGGGMGYGEEARGGMRRIYEEVWGGGTHLPLTERLRPNKVQIPRDMERDANTVTTAVKPRPHFDLTKSIFSETVQTSAVGCVGLGMVTYQQRR